MKHCGYPRGRHAVGELDVTGGFSCQRCFRVLVELHDLLRDQIGNTRCLRVMYGIAQAVESGSRSTPSVSFSTKVAVVHPRGYLEDFRNPSQRAGKYVCLESRLHETMAAGAVMRI